MWITAWLLVASGALYQPNLPPFADRASCELAREAYLRNRNTGAAACIEAKVYVNVPR